MDESTISKIVVTLITLIGGCVFYLFPNYLGYIALLYVILIEFIIIVHLYRKWKLSEKQMEDYMEKVGLTQTKRTVPIWFKRRFAFRPIVVTQNDHVRVRILSSSDIEVISIIRTNGAESRMEIYPGREYEDAYDLVTGSELEIIVQSKSVLRNCVKFYSSKSFGSSRPIGLRIT